MEIPKTYYVIEVIRLHFSGEKQILRIIDVDKINSIIVDHEVKTIHIYLKEVDNDGMNKRISFEDENLSEVYIRFNCITRIN